MSKLRVASVVIILTLFTLTVVSLMSMETTVDIAREDLSRLTPFEQLDKLTNVFLWNYWALGVLIQALVTLAAGIGISMLVRGGEEK